MSLRCERGGVRFCLEGRVIGWVCEDIVLLGSSRDRVM